VGVVARLRSVLGLFALSLIVGCGNAAQFGAYNDEFRFSNPPRAEIDPLEIDETALVKHTHLLTHTGEEGVPADPRDASFWPYGALVVPTKDGGTFFTCTTAHVSASLVVFSGHCLQSRKGEAKPLAKDHYVMFYDMAKNLRCVRLEKILYFSGEKAKDIAIASISSAAARDWHVLSRDLVKSIARANGGLRRALVMSFDPGSKRPDLNLPKGTDSAVFAVKRCTYFETAPKLRNKNTGKELALVENKIIDPSFQGYLDGCQSVYDNTLKTSMPGNSGSLVIDEDTNALVAVLEAIAVKKDLANYEYQSHFQDPTTGTLSWLSVDTLPGDKDFSILQIAIKLESVVNDSEFKRSPDYNYVFGPSNGGPGFAMRR
jgi:hypothetical protein